MSVCERIKWKWIIIVVVIVAVGSGAVIFAGINSSSVRVQKMLDLGQQYLEDGEYEQAVASFEEVLKIDPKNVDAYIGEADAYVAMGDYETAIALLEKGFGLTGDERLSSKLRNLETVGNQQEEVISEADKTEKAGKTEELETRLEDFSDLLDFTTEYVGYTVVSFASYEERKTALDPWIKEMEKLIVFLRKDNEMVIQSEIQTDGWTLIDVSREYQDSSLLSSVYATLSQCYNFAGEMEKSMNIRQEWADYIGNDDVLSEHKIETEGPYGTHTVTYDGVGRLIENADLYTGSHDTYTYDEKGSNPLARVMENMLYPSGTETYEYQYDEEGRINRIEWHTDGTDGAWVKRTWEFDIRGDTVSAVKTGTDSLGNDVNETYSFHIDEFGLPTDRESFR